MDRLFRPWRFAYVSRERDGEGCVLCEIARADASEDGRAHVVHRGREHFVVLNLFPYNTGHLMIVPYSHVANLGELSPGALAELASLAARAESVLGEAYHPEGFNLGMNLGTAAGAGIDRHLHLHVVPRWSGDSNFMTIAGETRVLPEDLDETWRKLHARF